MRAVTTTSILTLCGLAAQAQYRTSLQGSVTDTNGAVLPGAVVTLHDNATGFTETHKSNPAGVFNFAALAADHYTLTVVMPGFQKKVLTDLTFIPEQANSVNVTLALGDVSQTVNVDASTAPALDTETSNVGTTLTSNDVQHYVTNARDVFTLSQLAPGAISDGSRTSDGGGATLPGNQGPGASGGNGQMPTENGPQLQANGGQYQTNGISIDGISTVSAVWGGTTIITPNLDSIDNVRIVTNTYDAEYGRFSGAETVVTSKSGTNQIHGSAFFGIHRPGLNAYQPTVRYSNGSVVGSALRDTSRFNQYGGSLGGPIIKNRLFAFFAYEESPDSTNTVSNSWYETPQFRASTNQGPIATIYNNFSGVAPQNAKIITNGINCGYIGLIEGSNCATIAGQGLDIGSPLKIGVGKQDPTATGTVSNPGVGGGLDGIPDVAYYQTSTPSTTDYKQYNGRMDYQATQKDRISFAIYWVPFTSTTYNGGARSYDYFLHNQVNEALSGIWNHTFNANLLNEARANAAGWRWNELASNPQLPVGLPDDSVAFFAPNATLNQFGPSIGSHADQWTFTYKDVLTAVLGRHTLKAGGEFTQLHELYDPTGAPTFNFYNIWDFLNDAPYKESGGFNPATGYTASSRSDQRENLFGIFVQDDYKVKPTLTLHAGLRYSYFGSLYAKQNNLGSAYLGSGTSTFTNLTVAQGRPIWQPQKLNFGPQLGFNWSPENFRNKLVVRGGFGLSYNQNEIAITGNTIYNATNTVYPTFQWASPTNPGANGNDIVYGLSSNIHSIYGYPQNPNAISTFNAAGLPTAGNANVVILSNGTSPLKTQYSEHYSLDSEYQLNRELVTSIGYEGSQGRHLINHANPLAETVGMGATLNPLITSGDYWANAGMSNFNALLIEVKHPTVHQFSADFQFQWSKSMDTDGSGPYYEDPYFPLNPGYSYGLSDFNVGKSVKAFGLWQPIFFHGHDWREAVLGGWALSGIFQFHTGFPWSPNYGTSNSLYCTQCGTTNIRPYYRKNGGHDRSNKAFINATDFPNAAASGVTKTATVNGTAGTAVQYSNQYFYTPNLQAAMQYSGTSGFPNPNQALPPAPGLDRNAFTGPYYHDIDMSLAKTFGLPKNRVTGEHTGLEVRCDALNVFNMLNLDPTVISTNINATNFGQDTGALGGRVVSFTARLSF